MKVENLKNYGKPLSDIMLDPEAEKYRKQMTKTMRAELRKEIGLIGILKLMLKLRKELKRMKNHDWSSLKKRGLGNQRFLDSLIMQLAAMKVLVDMVGIEKASEIYRRLSDKTAYDMMAPTVPSVEDFKACGDVFESFKEYVKALMEADRRAGLHEIDIVEDSPSALAYNVKYCAWCEVAKELGDPSLCYATSCYVDEVFFPKVLGQAGARFKRSGTLATGKPVCDFRFELVTSTDS